MCGNNLEYLRCGSNFYCNLCVLTLFLFSSMDAILTVAISHFYVNPSTIWFHVTQVFSRNRSKSLLRKSTHNCLVLVWCWKNENIGKHLAILKWGQNYTSLEQKWIFVDVFLKSIFHRNVKFSTISIH